MSVSHINSHIQDDVDTSAECSYPPPISESLTFLECDETLTSSDESGSKENEEPSFATETCEINARLGNNESEDITLEVEEQVMYEQQLVVDHKEVIT